jgi:hypothetical protein
MGSRSFSGQSPQVAHIVGGHGIGREVGDLRNDVEAAFTAIEVEVDAITGGPFTRFTALAATTGALPANTRTGNILEADANGALGTIDGVTLVAGVSRLLVKNEGASHLKHGLYLVDSLGSAGTKWHMTRVPELDSDAEMLPGVLIMVTSGTANADTLWTLTTDGPISINATALTFAKASLSAATLASTAGAGFVGLLDSADLYTGTTLELALAEAGSFIRVKEATITFAELNALGGVKSGAVDVGTVLPAGARFAGAELVVGTLFRDVGDTAAVTGDLGTETAGHEDWGVDGTANNLHTTGTKTGGTNMVTFGRTVSAEQASIKVTSDVNLDTLTAGSLVARVWYFILA